MSLLSLAAAALMSQAALAADVTLKTADGVELHGVHEPVPGATKAVLLVHGDRRSSNDWKFLQGKIEHAGMASLAIDLRGHGDSQGVGVPPLPEETYQAMTADVTAGLAYLRERGATEIMLVGAELGATLALSAGAEAPDTTNIVLLSPSLKVFGIRSDAALKAWGERSVLFVVSSDDPYSAKSALLLEAQARGPKHMEIYSGAGKGASMLNREPACEGLVLSWLLGSHTLTDRQAEQSGPQITEDERLEADGMELEEVIGR
jgi:alpha-beta hydrolase superfamily lysophospholipase